MTLRYQIVALAIIPLIVAILTITAFITWQSANLVQSSIATFEKNMLKAKETELLNLTNLALSAIQKVYEEAGPNDEDAMEKVRAILTSLDYGVTAISSFMITTATMSCIRASCSAPAITGSISPIPMATA